MISSASLSSNVPLCYLAIRKRKKKRENGGKLRVNTEDEIAR